MSLSLGFLQATLPDAPSVCGADDSFGLHSSSFHDPNCWVLIRSGSPPSFSFVFAVLGSRCVDKLMPPARRAEAILRSASQMLVIGAISFSSVMDAVNTT